MLQDVKPLIEYETTSSDFGRFVISPLQRGFGITMGNALRRVLLNSLPGAAVAAVKIEGVSHEFSTIPYMKEDMIDFLLNVKGIRIRPLSGRQGNLYLEILGEGPVLAGDIKSSADFEIANPELILATLDSPEAKLDVEFQVELGKGYKPAVDGGNYSAIGIIPVDAIFTPIRRVNYDVEKTRVGQVSDYDKLTLEIWTDGTITPQEALSRSAEILREHFSLLSRPLEKLEEDKRNISVEQLGFSSRTLNSLRRNKIATIGELLEKSEEELLNLKNFGQKSLEEVLKRLEEIGLAEELKITGEKMKEEVEERNETPNSGTEVIEIDKPQDVDVSELGD